MEETPMPKKITAHCDKRSDQNVQSHMGAQGRERRTLSGEVQTGFTEEAGFGLQLKA